MKGGATSKKGPTKTTILDKANQNTRSAVFSRGLVAKGGHLLLLLQKRQRDMNMYAFIFMWFHRFVNMEQEGSKPPNRTDGPVSTSPCSIPRKVA